MSKISIIVQLEVKPGEREALLERARVHARASMDEEPGCLGFAVMVPQEGDNGLVFVETYADKAALDAHLATDRLQAFRDFMLPRVAGRTLTFCDLEEV